MYKDLSIIIPAAGRSSRFKTKLSKIFYVYKKKLIIEHILNKMQNVSNEVIIITSPTNYKKLLKISKKYKSMNIQFVIQHKPKGMGHAVYLGLKKIRTRDAGVIWADQIFLLKKTILGTIKIFLSSNSILCFPIFFKKNPYVYVSLKNEKFYKIIQTRESERKIEKGYSDCGFFVFKTKIVKQILKKLILNKKIITKKTKEIDFLKSFTFLKKFGEIITVHANSVKDTNGINYLEDLK